MNETKPQDPAFPNEFGETGLTKLEYFAAMAMQGLLVNQKLDDEDLAGVAYWHAKYLIEQINELNELYKLNKQQNQ